MVYQTEAEVENIVTKIPEQQTDESAFLKTYEKVFTAFLVLITVFHMVCAALACVINMETIKRIEPNIPYVLAAGLLFYIIISAVRYPWNLKRIRAFISRMFTYEQIYFIILWIWFIISIQVNHNVYNKNYYSNNRWNLYDLFFNALILLPLAKLLCREKAKKIIERVLFIVLIAYSGFTFYILPQMFQLNRVVMPSGYAFYVQEKPMAFRWGMHYNLTASYSFVMLVLCLCFMTNHNKIIKIISIFLFPIHLFACHLTNSRTIFYTGIVIFALFLFLCVWNRHSEKNTCFRIIAALTAVGIGILFYVISRQASFLLFENISHVNEIVYNTDASITERIRPANTNIGARRRYWKVTLTRIFNDRTSFFFGVTPSKAPYTTESGFRVDHAHNIVLQIGLCYGFPAMIGFVIFLFLICMKTVRLLYYCIKDPSCFLFIKPVIIIISLLIPGLVEIHIVRYGIERCVFMLISGWILELSEQKAIVSAQQKAD